MPQKAISEKGEIVLAFLFKNKFDLVDSYPQVFCPDCETKMFARGGDGTSRILHFAHANREARCTSPLSHHPESIKHELGKIAIYKKFYAQLSKRRDASNHSIQIEYPIRPCGKNGRRADVALLYKGNLFSVIECQLSAISQQNLLERIQDYVEQRIPSTWFLGGAANTPENRQTVLKYADALGVISFDEDYCDLQDIAVSVYGDEPQDGYIPLEGNTENIEDQSQSTYESPEDKG